MKSRPIQHQGNEIKSSDLGNIYLRIFSQRKSGSSIRAYVGAQQPFF